MSPQSHDSQNILYVGEENAFSLYVNSTDMSITPWDIRIKIGENIDVKDNKPVVRKYGTITMSPSHAKATLVALQTTIRMFEEKFGEIDLTKINQAVAAAPLTPPSLP
jgi:hypothetical protein